MNKQEIFDTVVNHLRTQGRKSIDNNGYCKYRSAQGLKCAIGCLIPDDQYSPIMENKSPSAVSRKLTDNALSDVFYENRDLLSSLQAIHDHYEVREWEIQLELVADKFRIAYTPKEAK